MARLPPASFFGLRARRALAGASQLGCLLLISSLPVSSTETAHQRLRPLIPWCLDATNAPVGIRFATAFIGLDGLQPRREYPYREDDQAGLVNSLLTQQDDQAVSLPPSILFLFHNAPKSLVLLQEQYR